MSPQLSYRTMHELEGLALVDEALQGPSAQRQNGAIAFSSGKVLDIRDCSEIAPVISARTCGLVVSVGYDDHVSTKELSRSERHELARMMIAEWAEWAHAGGRP